jgi:hypothetical protein
MNSSCFSTSSPVPLGTLTPLASRRRQIWVTCARNPGDSSWIKWWISDQNSMNDHHDFTSMIIMILHQWSSWFYINDHHDFTSWHYNGILSSSSFFIMTLQWHQKNVMMSIPIYITMNIVYPPNGQLNGNCDNDDNNNHVYIYI